MTPPKLILILSENWTLVPPNDLRSLVRMALDAEDAGFDAVMVSEHVVLGSSSGRSGQPENPRDYALPENQDPRTPWPSSLLLLAAVAAATERIRLVAGAVIPPLRHPLLLAKELATLDLLSEGRLVVQPTVSWHRDEYEALGVPYRERGERLDEHLAAWRSVWAMSPASFEGRHYRFTDVFLEPKPFRSEGPPLWFGGSACTTASSTGWWPTGADSIPSDARPRTTSIVCARRWRRPGAVSTISRWWAARGARSAMPAAWPTWGKPWQRPRRSSKRASPRSASSHRSSPTIRLPWVRCVGTSSRASQH